MSTPADWWKAASSTSAPPNHATAQDALLSSLLSTPSSPPSPAPPKNRPLPGSPRPAAPASRTSLRELVEQATGLGRSASTSDGTARETAVAWLRAGRASPADMLRAVAAGSGKADAGFNVRVLAFVHWVSVRGGPGALASACEGVSARKGSIGLKICGDVLRACGVEVDGGIERIRAWRFEGVAGKDRKEKDASTKLGPSLILVAVEMYALIFMRNLAFHATYPEVEANYSLDRFYRQFHLENSADDVRANDNLARHSAVISLAMGLEVAEIARGFACVAAALDRAKVSIAIVSIVFTTACNSYSLARYVLSKTAGAGGERDRERAEKALSRIEPVREWLAKRIKAMEARDGDGMRTVRRLVEKSVVDAIDDPARKPVRPESSHRREVTCLFSSFEGMHTALAPAVRL